MRTVAARPIGPDAYVLGECPTWEAGSGQLWWADLPSGRLFRTEPAGLELAELPAIDRVWTVADRIGSFAPAADGGLIVADTAGMSTVSPEGAVTVGPRLLAPGSRFNDGAVDPAGRFVAGTLSTDHSPGGQSLYSVESDGRIVRRHGGLTLANGMAWSADGRTLFLVESMPGVVYRMDYDVDSGRMGPFEVAFRPSGAMPDGLCLDDDGNLWIAFWGGGEVRCFTPDGEELARVVLTAPHVTSVAFAGPDLDLLVITTATYRLTPEELAAGHDSGRLFLADVGVSGPPTRRWAGRSDAELTVGG